MSDQHKVRAIRWGDPSGPADQAPIYGLMIDGKYLRINGKNIGWPTKAKALAAAKLILSRSQRAGDGAQDASTKAGSGISSNSSKA